MHSTAKRVAIHSPQNINREIFEDTCTRLRLYANASPQAIDERLRELDREWDIERTLEANAATAVLVGCALGITVDKRWFAFPAVVGAFLLQHAVDGWCPPLSIWRRLGVRTSREIEYERNALKALRGDFDGLGLTPPGESDHFAIRAMQSAIR